MAGPGGFLYKKPGVFSAGYSKLLESTRKEKAFFSNLLVDTRSIFPPLLISPYPTLFRPTLLLFRPTLKVKLPTYIHHSDFFLHRGF